MSLESSASPTLMGSLQHSFTHLKTVDRRWAFQFRGEPHQKAGRDHQINTEQNWFQLILSMSSEFLWKQWGWPLFCSWLHLSSTLMLLHSTPPLVWRSCFLHDPVQNKCNWKCISVLMLEYLRSGRRVVKCSFHVCIHFFPLYMVNSVAVYNESISMQSVK